MLDSFSNFLARLSAQLTNPKHRKDIKYECDKIPRRVFMSETERVRSVECLKLVACVELRELLLSSYAAAVYVLRFALANI